MSTRRRSMREAVGGIELGPRRAPLDDERPLRAVGNPSDADPVDADADHDGQRERSGGSGGEALDALAELDQIAGFRAADDSQSPLDPPTPERPRRRQVAKRALAYAGSPPAKVEIFLPRTVQHAMQDLTRPEVTGVDGQQMFGAKYVARACALAAWELVADRLEMTGVLKDDDDVLERVRAALTQAQQDR